MKTGFKCIVCGGNEYMDLFSCSDFLVTHEKFNIVKCKNCHLKATFPSPDIHTLPSYYKSDEYSSHSESARTLVDVIYRVVRLRMIRKKYKWINTYIGGGNLLDIGCGTGELLEYFRKRKWDVKGIEPNDKARMLAEEKNLIVLETLEEILHSKERYSVISMWHVLEHVPDPNQYLTIIRNILDEKGVLVVALPNPESLDAKIYGPDWAAYDVPRHLFHFNPMNVEQLFKKNGFYLINEIPMKFDAYYISMLSEQIKNGKKNFIKAFILGFRSNFWAAMNDKNYSSKVYIFKKYINV